MQRGHSRHCVSVYLQELSIPGRRRSTVPRVAKIRGATLDDLDEVYELLDVRSRRTQGISEITLEQLQNRWAQPGFAIGEDNWVAEDNGRIMGYAALDASHGLDHAAKDPHVGDALLARAEE